jgi:hypothetical protein
MTSDSCGPMKHAADAMTTRTQWRSLMKSALPSAIALGVLVFGAAGSQAYGPSPGSAPLLATEPAFTKVHASPKFHADCRFGEGKPGSPPRWHRHRCRQTSTGFRCRHGTIPCGSHKVDAPVAGPPGCASRPVTRCKGFGWSCVRWDSFQNCCARWVCPAVIKYPQTREPSRPPRALPWSRRLPPSPFTR